MNVPPPDSPVIKFTTPKPQGDGRWPLRRWLMFIILIFAVHVAAIFTFGSYKLPVSKAVTDVPQLQLANNSSELVLLGDPTLFALPHKADSALLSLPEVKPPEFRWSDTLHWLPMSSEQLGATFNQFMQTNVFGTYELEFKPAPKFNVPQLSVQPLFAETSTLQVEGNLARRKLLNEIVVPDLAYADVIAPSKVQLLVSSSGDVISAVLLESSGWNVADQRAIELAKTARFAPASKLTVGQMNFNWRTVAPSPAGSGNG